MRALTTPDGLALVLHPELTPTGAARGSVLIVHGLGEHAGRYAHVAAAVCPEGCPRLAKGLGSGQTRPARLATTASG